jgi:hypothetical protein
LKSDAASDEPIPTDVGQVSSNANPSREEDNGIVDLSQSLSGAYFKQKRIQKQSHLPTPLEDVSLPPPPPPTYDSLGTYIPNQNKYDQQLRESAVQMSEMLERMKAMGLVQSGNDENNDYEDDANLPSDPSSKERSNEPTQDITRQSSTILRVAAEEIEELYDTNTALHLQHPIQSQKLLNHFDSEEDTKVSSILNHVKSLETQLKTKQHHYLSVLRYV